MISSIVTHANIGNFTVSFLTNILPELLWVRQQLQGNQNHVWSMKNVSKAFEYLRLRFVAVLCCIEESGPDLVNPSTLLSPSWKIKRKLWFCVTLLCSKSKTLHCLFFKQKLKLFVFFFSKRNYTTFLH